MSLRRTILALGLIFAVGGCENPWLEQHGLSEERLLTRGWVKTREVAATQVYCYSTIGDTQCYHWPQQGDEARLVGYSGIAPHPGMTDKR